MTARGEETAALALHRFGFGPGRYSIAMIATDPRGALLADLERRGAGRITDDLPSSGEAARAVFDFRAEQRAKQILAQRAKNEVAANSAAPVSPVSVNTAAGSVLAPAPKPENPAPPLPQRLLQDEAKARLDAATGADIGFVERLVWFWSNHFCISADKIVEMAGPYEREAIRPHVLGHFVDMLEAVESHPGMLVYLDNVQSMGMDSIAGINGDKGLNENLARETLELHTLGVRSGYTQKDVTSFANVLTGWTWIPPAEPIHGGEFVFIQRQHQPGAQTVLGKSYSQPGMAQGRAVLTDLVRHPATAQHIATKLARHFVADEPPPALVAKLAKTFGDSDGDLKEVAKTLVTADESWTPLRSKLKPPSEWIVGVLRLTGAPSTILIGRIVGAQAALGEALWRPPAPNGYPDSEAAWIDGVPQRLDIANEFASRLAANTDPLALLDSSLGPLASPDTRDTIARAESRAQALALLVMTPEFLRR
ncbi:MAG TPA: DUF1800 family protein [Xanthobacteraceae bacterium]|jgi:uncharacterized protein (DUF1800 family)